MAKFINKKEQVFDIRLTTYGRYLLSVGNLKPAYYAFFDDNVIYDSRYANARAASLTAPPLDTLAEPQNDIHNRIKNETQYIESLTLFEGVESSDTTNEGTVNFFDLQDLAAKRRMRKDIFRFDSAIGDANLDGDTDLAPAWKVVALQSEITSSTAKDEHTYPSGSINIPQININANYVLKTKEFGFNLNPRDVRGIDVTTNQFIDGKVITLEQTDPLIYVEEKNTQIFTENFDIEVFDILTGSNGDTSLERKFFKKLSSQIKDGLMVSPKKIIIPESEITSGSVEYYFDLLADFQVDHKLACAGAQTFNKDSYYVDFDFDCEGPADEDIFFDIYGAVTEPEICFD